MPRIDPLQLLKCLSVLLSPEGGILSRDEVPRLVNLMTKFSKKLVSKCVYVLILKSTETSLVDMFMAEGGWTLIQTWLQDTVPSGNWDLVKEILELLLVTPVDVERLKMNNLPKLVKNLSRREDVEGVAQLSNQIVQKWLTIVKGYHDSRYNVPEPKPDKNEIEPETPEVKEDKAPPGEEKTPSDDPDNSQAIKTTSFYKMAVKDGKQVIRKLSVDKTDDGQNEEPAKKNGELKKVDEDAKTTVKDKESRKSSSSSRSSKDKDREKDKKKSSSSSSSSSSRSKSSSSRDKDGGHRDKSRHSSSSSSKSRSSSSSSSKDKKDRHKSTRDSKEQAEKDKESLEKLKPPSLEKLGRIPKKSSSSTEEKQKENKPKDDSSSSSDKKKPSFSILNRKSEERSKTVKVFNSKMRSTGLEEEVKPPPPRTGKKPAPSVQLPTIPPKRPSPPREPSAGVPPEKKLKMDRVDVPERPGAIKLIAPKPKPVFLQESDMFMDALTASAPKKEMKKRKRRPSVTKDVPSSPTLGLKGIAPINFYQDTLTEASDNKSEEDAAAAAAASPTPTKEAEEEEEDASPPSGDPSAEPPSSDSPTSPTNNTVDHQDDNKAPPLVSPTKTVNGLKGVLLYSKKRGPKRSIKWKAEEELVEVRFFELDETERVNVTKTFMDMAKMEVSGEREALIMSRKLSNEDVMEPQTVWRMLFVCEQPEPLAAPGSKSLEKDIQFAREKTAIPALYFDKRRIPDSAEEPVPENHQMSDPVIIPLEDPESQEYDLRGTPWPEPKGLAPQLEPQPMPQMFPNVPFNPGFNNLPPGPQGFGVGMVAHPPRFPPPHGPFVAGNFAAHPPAMMGGPPINPPDMMNAMPHHHPGMFVQGAPAISNEVFNDPNFPMQQFNGPPQGPPMFGPPNNFPPRGGRGGGGGGGGGFRRGGGPPNQGGWRPIGPRNWKRGGAGGGRNNNKSIRMCKNVENHGYCRNMDNCPFGH